MNMTKLETLERELAAVKAEIAALRAKPKMKKVRNLMTGKMVEIAEDTPMVCDPSTEIYWSM
jgi:hypothetical protein